MVVLDCLVAQGGGGRVARVGEEAAARRMKHISAEARQRPIGSRHMADIQDAKATTQSSIRQSAAVAAMGSSEQGPAVGGTKDVLLDVSGQTLQQDIRSSRPVEGGMGMALLGMQEWIDEDAQGEFCAGLPTDRGVAWYIRMGNGMGMGMRGMGRKPCSQSVQGRSHPGYHLLTCRESRWQRSYCRSECNLFFLSS